MQEMELFSTANRVPFLIAFHFHPSIQLSRTKILLKPRSSLSMQQLLRALQSHFQVSSMELVQEIHQVLMDREDTCHRTCFSLQLDGVTLDNFSELKSIEGLKEGSVIKVVEGTCN